MSVLAAHSSSSMSASVSASSYDDTDTDMQTPPISTSSRHVVSSASSQSSTGSAKVKVSRDQKTVQTAGFKLVSKCGIITEIFAGAVDRNSLQGLYA